MTTRIRVGQGSLSKSLVALLVGLIIAGALAGLLCLVPGVGGVLAVIVVCLYVLFVLLVPVLESYDVSDRLPELKEARKTNKDLRKISIRHQYFWAILAINILFGVTGVGFVVAFIMAHMPCTVDAPPEVVALLTPKGGLVEGSAASL
jgi:MFS family permease